MCREVRWRVGFIEGGQGHPGDHSRAHCAVDVDPHPLTRAQRAKSRIHRSRGEGELDTVIEHDAAAARGAILERDSGLHPRTLEQSPPLRPGEGQRRALGGPTVPEQTRDLGPGGGTHAKGKCGA